MAGESLCPTGGRIEFSFLSRLIGGFPQERWISSHRTTTIGGALARTTTSSSRYMLGS
ncbi:hypothetical protein BDW22DRAFT_1363613 [Trametopsis cervina]|nr:hypothetical protein BDW22DRAFT_1363613 [Trametopsis cervina]